MREGYVYVIDAEGLSRCKVGWTIDPDQRLVNMQACSPVRLKLAYAFKVRHPWRFERAVHRELAPRRLWGEWFEIRATEAVALVGQITRREREARKARATAQAAKRAATEERKLAPDRELSRLIKERYPGEPPRWGV